MSQMSNEAVIISTQATRHYGVSSLNPCEIEDFGQPKHRCKYSGNDRVRRVGFLLAPLHIKADLF